MKIVAFILTKDIWSYKQWLRLVNDGENILESDLEEFPRITSVEQLEGVDPLPMVYTWGNYYVNDKMEQLYRNIEAKGVKVIPSPTEEKVGARS